MKITGHNRFETFSLCENIDGYAARRAALLLDQLSKKEKPSDLGESEGEFIVNRWNIWAWLDSNQRPTA
jgi:hypothetical protein